MILTVACFRAKLLIPEHDASDTSNWETITVYSTTWPFVKCSNPPTKTDYMDAWLNVQLRTLSAAHWGDSNKHKWWIPEGNRLQHAVRINLKQSLRRVSSRGYMNRNPWSVKLCQSKDDLHRLLSKANLNEEYQEELEAVLRFVILASRINDWKHNPSSYLMSPKIKPKLTVGK